MSFSVNDRVFAYWEADEYYYPATITEIDGDSIYIRYDDGNEEWTESDYLSDLAVEVGEKVEAMWSEDERYYYAEVLAVKGEQVQVAWYDESGEEWVAMSALRSWDDEE